VTTVRYIRLAECLATKTPAIRSLLWRNRQSGWVSREIGLVSSHVVYKYPWTDNPRGF